MTGSNFIVLLLENWHYYILSLLMSFICLIPIFKVLRTSIIDPYNVNIFFTGFANAIPLFLFFTNEISVNDFSYFICAEFIFWMGFLHSFKKEYKTPLLFNIKYEQNIYKQLFHLFFIFFILFDLYTFQYRGIPLFLDYRMELYSDAGGSGIIARILPLFKMYCIYYSIEKLVLEKKYYFLIYIIVFIIDGILWGSKSGFIYIVFGYFFVHLRHKMQSISIRTYLCFGVLILAIGIAGLLFTDSIESALITFFYRFIASGDIYYYAYPEQMYMNVNIPDKWIYIPSFFLAPARLMDYLPYDTAGIQIFKIIYPVYLDAFSGPNPRMPFISYVLFGWGGLLFSFFAGKSISLIRRIIKKLFYNSCLLYPLYAYIYTESCFLIYDFAQGISNLFSIMINIILFFACAILINILIITMLKMKNCYE